MSKAKPFLFGTALGASAMFAALQYHVVHSHDGFQIIPRTPQQSVGLAYSDIRNWSPSQWTDRPELARAMMAHGAADLISESVANTLADSVSEDTSTLEELRSFLNNSKSLNRPDDNSRLPMSSDGGSAESSDDESPATDIFRIPFPQDAGIKAPADPFRVAGNKDADHIAKPAAGSRFSTADVLAGLIDTSEPQPTRPVTAEPPPAAVTKTNRSAAEQAQVMEERIFGKGFKVQAPATAKPIEQPETSGSMFEEVSTALENRAQDALNRAKQVISSTPDSATKDKSGPSEEFIRSKLTAVKPSAVKPIESEAPGKAAAPSSPLLNDFDPFLE